MSYLRLRDSGVYNLFDHKKKQRYLHLGGEAEGPEQSGLQYDRDVPDDMVIGSPGGVSSTFHHYTHGFYGKGGSSNDIYGGDQPSYISGEYGNLYQLGDNAAINSGAYSRREDELSQSYWKNQFPSVLTQQQVSPKTNLKAGRPQTENFEMIEEADEPFSLNVSTSDAPDDKVKIHPLVLFLVFLIAYICISLWSGLIFQWVKEKFNNGKEFTTHMLLIFSIVFTLLLVFISWSLSIPLGTFEQLSKNPLDKKN